MKRSLSLSLFVALATVLALLAYGSFPGEAPAHQLHNFTLTVSRGGSSAGTVGSTPAGISCGTTCSASYPHGSQITLTATASANATFAGWSGGCSGTGTCKVSMYADHTVTATFDALPPKDLAVVRGGSGLGTVRSSPSGIDCGSACAATYDHGTSVTLTATADGNSTFAGWSGDCSGTGSCALTMDAPHSATATFERKPECVVPRVIGMTLRPATQVLVNGRCSLGRVTRKYSRTRKGRVISQAPKAGVHSPAGSAVALVLSRGRRPR